MAEGAADAAEEARVTDWFPCCWCGARRGLLVRGLCKACGPQEHAEYERQSAASQALSSRYRAETGANEFADWYRFEAWAQSQSEWAEFTAVTRRKRT